MKFTKWIVVTCALILLTFLGTESGTAQRIMAMDSTHLTLAIMALFVLGHFGILILVTEHSEPVEEKLWFIAEALVSLGMIGTVLGFTMLFGEAFAVLDVEDPASITAVITDMALGMGTALVTTLVGLVCSLILKGELVFIGRNHE